MKLLKKDFIVKLKAYNVISEESIKLHGITNEISLQKGENIEIVLNQFFKDYQTVDLIVAHNMEFDSYMIKVELIRLITGKDNLNRDEFDDCLKILSNSNNLYCSMQESIELCKLEVKDKTGRPYFKFPKLIELYSKLFNETPQNLHNSFNDVLVTLRCYMKMKYDKDIINVNPEMVREFEKII